MVGEAEDGEQAVELTHRLRPDVVLMDIRMPRMDGIKATRSITASGSRTRVLVLTTFDLDDYAFGALRAGASGFVLKDVSPSELVEAIHMVASGDAIVSPRVTRRLLEEYAHIVHLSEQERDDRFPELSALTERERGSGSRRSRTVQRRGGHKVVRLGGNREVARRTAAVQAEATIPCTTRRPGVRGWASLPRRTLHNWHWPCQVERLQALTFCLTLSAMVEGRPNKKPKTSLTFRVNLDAGRRYVAQHSEVVGGAGIDGTVQHLRPKTGQFSASWQLRLMDGHRVLSRLQSLCQLGLISVQSRPRGESRWSAGRRPLKGRANTRELAAARPRRVAVLALRTLLGRFTHGKALSVMPGRLGIGGLGLRRRWGERLGSRGNAAGRCHEPIFGRPVEMCCARSTLGAPTLRPVGDRARPRRSQGARTTRWSKDDPLRRNLGDTAARISGPHGPTVAERHGARGMSGD